MARRFCFSLVVILSIGCCGCALTREKEPVVASLVLSENLESAEQADATLLHVKLESVWSPQDLGANLASCQNALYWIRVVVVLEGKFSNFSYPDWADVSTVSYPSGGNGFAVDAEGNVLTNAHIVEPARKLAEAFANSSYWEGSQRAPEGYAIKALTGILIKYYLKRLDGTVYFSQYRLALNDFSKMEFEKVDDYGQIKLVSVDALGDLALINVPTHNQPYLEFAPTSRLLPNYPAFKFAIRRLRSDSVSRNVLAVNWGEVINPCEFAEISSRPQLVTSFRMYCEYGDSASPIVSPNDGKVLAVTQGKNDLQPLTFAVPGYYAQQFIRYALGQGEAPAFDCIGCSQP